MDPVSKEELCLDELGYIEPENITLGDILVFFEKGTKSDNDRNNKLRELIIENILNNKLPKKWYSSPQWFKVALRLKEFMKQLSPEPLLKVEIKGGRYFNYDFLMSFKSGDIKVEFKNGVKSIADYPEILSVSSNTFVKGVSYAEHFYHNYLPMLTNHEVPTKDFYLKNIHKNVVKHPFFIHLKEVDTFKEPVDESIDDYIRHFLEFDFKAFQEKIKNQFDKKFMLWDCEQFHLESLMEEPIIPELHFKKGRNNLVNTVIIKAVTFEYHLLLRWKNHAGVLYPAWQIKVKVNRQKDV
jgi:hypothetical protein